MRLQRVVHNLKEWQAGIPASKRGKRCLEAVRRACYKEGLYLPLSNIDYKGQLAIDNFKTLAKNPAKWGWKQVHSPLTEPCLVYFKNCGKLPDGRMAGHIAVLFDGVIWANQNYHWNQYWASRIVGAFIPIDEA